MKPYTWKTVLLELACVIVGGYIAVGILYFAWYGFGLRNAQMFLAMLLVALPCGISPLVMFHAYRTK